MGLTLTLVLGALFSGIAAGMWLGRMVAVAEIRGEVNKMLRNDDERAEAIAFLKTFSPDDIRAERRGRK